MVTIAKVFSTIKKLKKIRINSCCQQHFVYPLLFQDDIYGIAYNRFINESNYRKKSFFGLNNEFNFLKLKRLTRFFRQSSFSWLFYDESIDKLKAVQEIVIIILNFILSTQSETLMGNKNEWNSYKSIHSIFSFMEDRIRNSNSCLNITIPYTFHPENLIRIFRRRINDISFLHFLRLLLHQNDNLITNPHTIYYSGKNQFYCFLWNWHLHEFEYSLIYVWKEFYEFQCISSWFFFDRTNFVQKIGCISKKKKSIENDKIFERNYSIHYVRYQNNFIITISGSVESLKKNWKNFLIIFWQKYFHLWFEPYRVSAINLYRNPLFFLGYILRIRNNFLIIQTQLVNHLINTNLVTKEFFGTIPIVPMIGLLARDNFCDTRGHPTCKLSWTTLADNEIFERFDQITRSIACYYGGCLEKKSLYQLQYILRFSCAKTLACKHKGTIRTAWQKYGSNLVANYASSKSCQINLHRKKIWYLNIIQINFLVTLLHKLRNVRFPK
uniref:Maturase K n=1 Tax=Apopellia endiviifolia TaxID=304445 RepID=K4JTV6_9MARC|nr:maturase K [Apopellia endiviifolia]AFU88840.1 maturase K [Apopellia endiviifolia]WIA67723.1 maturase K [Apopellia endiviifolia]WKW94932.1 maturase K [Apopellia endiviifolia]